MAHRKVYSAQSLSDTIWFYLVYLESRLMHDPNAKDLAPRISALIDKVEDTWKGQRATWRADTVAQAFADSVNYLLDRATIRFSRALLNTEEIEQNTEHPHYKRYFTETLSRIVRLALETQMRKLRPWLNSIKTEPDTILSAFGAIFEDIFGQGDEALEQQRAAQAARKDFRGRDIEALVKEINKVCQEVYGTLVTRAASLNVPDGWVDSFFRKPKRSAAVEPTDLLRDALYNIFSAHGVELSEEQEDLLQNTKDPKIFDRWLAKAPSAKTVEEVLGAAPAPGAPE